MTDTDQRLTPRWTDDDMVLMHEIGREYEAGQMAILADDAANAPPLAPPPIPYERRVASRIVDMIRSSPPGEYRGGPVAWLPGWEPGAGDGP